MPSPNISGNNILFGVAALATNDVWAVGARGLIVRWDGVVWNVVPGPSPSAPGTNLYGVAAVSANDVWASGEHFVNGRPQTLLEHWDGSHWTVVPSPSPGGARSNRFFRIAATSANDVWAVGDYTDEVGTSRTLVEHWDGTQWSIVPSPNGGDPTSPYTINTLFGVAAVSTNDAWAVGYYREYYSAFYYIDHPLIEHWDGTQWLIAPADEVGTGGSSLEWVSPLSSGDVWAAGFFTNESYDAQTLVEHFSDPCATPTATPTSTPTATPTPNGCSVCNLSVTRVTISCNPDGTVHWTATIRNTGDCSVYDGWQASLQVKLRGRGHFATVRTQSGSTSFPPGRTTVSGDICYQFASNTAAVRAEFAPDRGRARCNPHSRSDGMPPCNRTASCP